MSLEDLTTDQLLAHARSLESSHNLLSTLLKDPASREIVQRKLKQLQPELSIPELDARDAMAAELAKEREAREKLESEIRQDRVTARVEAQRAAAKAKYNLNEADMKEVEKLIVDPDNPIPTYEAAARVHAASKQTAAPTSAMLSNPTYQMPETETWGKGIGNKAMLDKIAVNEAYAAFADIRAGKVAGLGPATTN